jgi:hypothetical protein
MNLISQLVQKVVRNPFVSITSKLAFLASASLAGVVSSFVFAEPAQAGTEYPLWNGQIVQFKLDNGQAINLTGAVNNGMVNSWPADVYDPAQRLRVVSDRVYYNFVRHGSTMGLSSQTLAPPVNEPMVTYATGNGRYQNFILDNIGGGRWLIRWQNNQNMCVNIPGGRQNVMVTLFTCNANDPDQRFQIVTVGGVENYSSPFSGSGTGFLEDANGKGLSIPNTSLVNGGIPSIINQSDFDESQKVNLIPSGNGFLIQRNSSNFSLSSNTLNYTTANQSGLSAVIYGTGSGR